MTIIAVPWEEPTEFRIKVLTTVFEDNPELHRLSDYSEAECFYDYYGFSGDIDTFRGIFRELLRNEESWIAAPMWYVENAA